MSNLSNSQLINQTTGEVEYRTPPEIIEAVHKLYNGRIDLDPASATWANKFIKAKKIYTKDQDGLTKPWSGCVWMNHPFGRGLNAKWVNKAVAEFGHGGVRICCITYACTSEQWFQPLLQWPQCFLRPRTNYYTPDGSVLRGVTKGSVVTYMADPVTFPDFIEAFKNLGVIKIQAL